MALLCAVLTGHAGLAQCIQSGPRNGSDFSNNNSTGSVAWANPGDAALSDNVRTQAGQVVAAFSSAQTNYLVVKGLGFAVPAGATICGISVSIEKSAVGISVAGSVKDAAVQLIKRGHILATNRASASAWSIFEGVTTYGGSTDAWGDAWTPGDVNANDFGVAIAATMNGGVVSVALAARINQVSITVYYLNPSILPVKLEQFTVTSSSAVSSLAWTASVDALPAHFLVDRSSDGADWHTIGRVEAVSIRSSYAYTDQHPLAGTGYYRLGMVDNSGRMVYSYIRQAPPTTDKIGFYPNPATQVITVTGRRHTPAIVLKDLQGRVVKRFLAAPAVRPAQVSLEHIPPGLYLLEIDGMVLRLQKAG